MDLVRLAESYVLQLLFEAPAERAVWQLSSEWERRATLGGPESLTEAETVVDRARRYAFLVRMGGHGCYFSHCPREEVDRTLLALQAVGLDEGVRLLGRALALSDPYPSQAEPSDLLRRARFVSDDVRFSELDRAAWMLPIYEAVLEYLRRNEDSVLLPERGVP